MPGNEATAATDVGTYNPVRYVPTGTESELTVTTSDDGLIVYRGPTPQSSGWLVTALKRVDDAKSGEG